MTTQDFTKPSATPFASFSEEALDKLRTYKEAAGILGLPYHRIQRAARKGLLPTYSIGGKRKYVRLRDIVALLKAPASLVDFQRAA